MNEEAELDLINSIVRNWLAQLACHMTVVHDDVNVVEVYLNAITNFTGMVLGPLPDEKRKKALHAFVRRVTEAVAEQSADFKRFKQEQEDD
jgi:hypothetical protein